MRMKKMYSVPGTNLADSDDYESLRKFADRMGHSEIDIIEIDAPWLENGDKIIIEKCVGSYQDEDGISTGGKWIDIEGVWVVSTGEYANDGNGSMFDHNGNHIQSVGADMRYNGFPYRNVRMAELTKIASSEVLNETPKHLRDRYYFDDDENEPIVQQCPEPYRRGIGQGFGPTEDG